MKSNKEGQKGCRDQYLAAYKEVASPDLEETQGTTSSFDGKHEPTIPSFYGKWTQCDSYGILTFDQSR